MLSDRDIARIAHRVAEECQPLAVGIFGSYAIGAAHERSDLDLFVVMNTADRPFARARAIRRILFGILHPLDIHVFTPEEFEETARETMSFAWIIVRQARLYFATDEAKYQAPSLF